MKLLHKKSGELHQAIIELVKDDDWKVIKNNKKFDFKWINEKDQIVHKIRLKVEEEILGLISIEDVPKEFRVHIRLVEINSENIGKNKKYDHIAGCLFAFTCRLAFKKQYGGYVSMHPKTALIDHYKNSYGFQEFGNNLYLELTKSENLIKKYLGDG